ncbi:glycoside hydrolase domain-containing protein [Paenibacillus koleovorans]|uniref:glycoside hydrolase domain-containing protein n=1 Tax=Paenibacillus koleovorans TaxID=121608 RepID=UPI000FDC1757|nr:glycoside hydrolase domain-containing protein [Paenibacillus koleovorans]
MSHSWLVTDMIRVCPQNGQTLETEGDLQDRPILTDRHLQAVSPRNAYLSFQIVLRTSGDFDLDDLDISPESLQGVGGAEIPAEEYELYVEWYHRIGDRYIPDALIPCKQASVSGNSIASISRQNAIPGQQYAAVWVDLFVPADATPGEYTGTIAIRRGSNVERQEWQLTVLETRIPNESTITASLNNYADSISNKFAHLEGRTERYTDGTYFEVEKQFYRMSHEHRTVFHNLPYSHDGRIPKSFAPELEGAGKSMRVKDWSLFDEHFSGYLDGSVFRGTKRGEIPIPHFYLPQNFHWPADYTKFGLKGYATEFASVFREFYEHFTERGWLSTKFELFFNHKKRYKLFPYDGDETRFVWDEKINDIYYGIVSDVLERKDGANFIFRTDSSWNYGLHYKKYADIIKHWVVNRNIMKWYPEGASYLQSRGCVFWFYLGAQPIDHNLLGSMIAPLASVAQRMNGFVLWNTVDWGSDWHLTPASNGKTAVFYPGDRLFGIRGPIPSIRLKSLRSSMQIAECMEEWIRQNGEHRRGEMTRLIGSILNGDSTFDPPPPPSLLDQPPYEWTNQLLSDASPVDLHIGRSPLQFEALKDQLWRKMG